MNAGLSVATRHHLPLGAGRFSVFIADHLAGPIVEIDPHDVELSLRTNGMGAFLTGQGAARLMLKAGKGTIIFSGATAGVKGFANSAPFAMGKFALRGLAQSMARELGPKGIHVAHVVIDGAIAENYLALHKQPRTAWTQELDLRPWVETF